MSPSPYTEDALVQQPTADDLEQQLGWESVYAHNHEDFGPDSLLGRTSEREVVLTLSLRERLAGLNPDLPDEAYNDAVRQITANVASQTIVAANREKYDLIFHHNAVVMFGNGDKARIGSITSRWGHFHEWKRLAEEESGAVDMQTLLKGGLRQAQLPGPRRELHPLRRVVRRDAEDPGPPPPVPRRESRRRGGAGAEGAGGEARCLPAHAGGRQELLDGDVHPQGAHSRFPGHALTPTGVMAIRCKQFHLPDL